MIEQLIEKQLKSMLIKAAREVGANTPSLIDQVELVIKPNIVKDEATGVPKGVDGNKYFIRYQGREIREITLSEVLSIE